MRLELSVLNPSTTVLESVKIRLELVNDSGAVCRVPGPYDLTQALTIEVYRADGELLRRMSGVTRQEMMSGGRINTVPTLDDLPAGGRWQWELDLASYHYALPTGEHEVRAVYTEPGGATPVCSRRISVRVAPVPLLHLARLCDAPVLEGMTMLLHGGDGQAENTTALRQHNAQRPLAAWYSERIEAARSGLSWDGPVKPFFAAARFFTTDSFEPTFVKWIVSTSATHLFAQRLFRGQLDPTVLSAPLPPGRRLLPSAFYDDDDRLTLCFQYPGGVIEACDLSQSGLKLLFRHGVPPTAVPPAIRADCDFIYVLTPWQGAVYDRLALDGTPRERKKPFTTRMAVVSCDIDPFRRCGRLSFRDSPSGRAFQLVTYHPRHHRTDVLTIDNLPLRGRVQESSFDEDGAGNFHLLVSTSGRQLYYLRNGRGPIRIMEGEERFFPTVHANAGLYLGCNSSTHGYRFLHFRPGAYRHRIAGFEDSA